MHTRFAAITNKLYCLCEVITPSKQIQKVLNILHKSWERKVDAINEACDLKTFIMDELIGNLKIYELKNNKINAKNP